jgi:hypothetical protein
VIFAFVVPFVAVVVFGCGGETIELKKPDPKAPAPEQREVRAPKVLQKNPGGSGGIKRDPSGMSR